MNFKLSLIFISLIMLKLVLTKSFTLVLDTTASMLEEIDVIKRNIHSLSTAFNNVTDFEEFIVVPFNDPDVGTPMITTSPEQLLESLRSLTIRGGHDCPEDSLSGIQKGLEISKPESFVYLFTDAYAKDSSKFRTIESLCRSSRSQVVIFLSGSCSAAESRLADVYYDVAKSCSGAVFRFDAISLRKAFKYIEEMITTDWNDIISHDPFTGYKMLTFSVDSFTRDILVAISGEYPEFQIFDSDRNSPRMQTIVDTKQSVVVRITNFKRGIYQVNVRGRGMMSVTFYKRNEMPFEYGFSTRIPRSLRETSPRPIPGWLNYILIVLPPTYNIHITSVEIQMADGNEKKTLKVDENENKQGYYVSSVFMEPDRSFRCVIHGKDSVTYEEITGSTKIVDVQKSVLDPKWTKPVVEIIEPDDNLVDFGMNTTIACKVKGYPKPEIQWENIPGSILTTEEVLLEIPSTYINYVTINVTSNSTVSCKAQNTKGDDEKSTELFVNRTFTFDIVESPKDETFEFGTEGKLYCKVEAYPEAEVNWYHNDSFIIGSFNIEILAEENALLIKNMTPHDVGTYKCEAKNAVKTEELRAEVTISGLEAPVIEIDNSEIILSPGDWKDIQCRVLKGSPKPELSWKYQNSIENEFDGMLPSDVVADGEKLKFPAVNIEHKGIYRCIASNAIGEDFKDVTVKVQYAPKITNTDEGLLAVMEGDMVELKCDVDAVPKARVRWEVTQDDVIMSLDSRHTTNDQNTHRFYALWRDSGNYHCIAENAIGKTERTITVNVLVPPFIQPPESKEIEVLAGSNLRLPCNVTHGNPEPATKWQFTAYDSTTKILNRGTPANAYLYLNNVSRANEGMYLCIAENNVGNDRIKIYVKVK